ncbi:MAG: ubiquinol-cytochrome c reductase iron-sulfur subunit [Myxococcota bacterium]
MRAAALDPGLDFESTRYRDGAPARAVRSAADTARRPRDGGVVAGVGLAVGCLPTLRDLTPTGGGELGGRIEIPADQARLWDAVRVLVGGRPAFVMRTTDRIYALSGVCTHLGCVVKWQRSRRIFFCPCHGGRFAPDGRVLGGPPPAPLPRFAVAVRQGKIVVRPA